MLIGRAWPKQVPKLNQFLHRVGAQQKSVIVILDDRHIIIKFAQVD
jgi:hypothetical protein